MTRRIASILLLISLLLAPFIARAASASGFLPASAGVETCYAQVGGWTVYCDGTPGAEGGVRIVGTRDGASPVELAKSAIHLTPAQDSFIYYGTASDAMQRWQLVYPDEPEHRFLPISWGEEVIGADDSTIWYYTTDEGPKRTIYQVGKDGKGKKRLGTLEGTVIARMDDGQILSCFYARGQVRLWSKGKYTMLYQAPKALEIRGVYTDGTHILMQLEDEFGLLENGAFAPLFRQHVFASANAKNQIVLVSFEAEDLESASECSVRLVDFATPGIAYLGTVPASTATSFCIEPDAVTVYTNDTQTRFGYPSAFEPLAPERGC